MTTNPYEFDTDVYSLPHLLDETITILQEERQKGAITGGKIYQNYRMLEIPENLAIVGDLHGDIQTLNQILLEINARKFLSNPKNKIIFLGDYVDRGNNSVKVICSICELKIRYPNSVILMRGNHEAIAEFPFAGHDLPAKITQVFGDLGDTIYDKILMFFQLLEDVVIVEKKIFLVHGGLPVETNMEYHSNMETLFEKDKQVMLEDFLWNDPRDIETWEISHRKFGRHFGKSVTKKWLDASNTCVIVRGHEPCQGFKIDHDGMVLTIFSCKESYPYFDAGYIVVTGAQLEKIGNAVDLANHVRKIKKER